MPEFHKIFDDLENIKVNIHEEDKVLLLLSSLPIFYKHFKNTFLYGNGCTIITFDEVQTTMRSKKNSKVKDLKIYHNNEGLSFSRRDGELKGMYKFSKFDKLMFKWFICRETDHFKKDCSKRKDNENYIHIAVVSDEDSYEMLGALVVSFRKWKVLGLKLGMLLSHVPKEKYFETLNLGYDGVVCLGNYRACKVYGVGMVKLKTLRKVWYVPDLK